jgi:hypothetical protein
MMPLFSVFYVFGLFLTADKGSWTSLFYMASQDMKAGHSGGYLEIHRRFMEFS